MKYTNNPFNIRFSKSNRWVGLLGNNNGFCSFVSLELGVRAAAYLLMVTYRKLGINTIREILFRFAPLSENDTFRYISFVSNKSGYNESHVLKNPIEYSRVLSAMWSFESGYHEYNSFLFILDVIRQYKIRMA